MRSDAQTNSISPLLEASQQRALFLILADGKTRGLQWHDTLFDHGVWSFVNCFYVWQEAKQAQEDMLDVLRAPVYE